MTAYTDLPPSIVAERAAARLQEQLTSSGCAPFWRPADDTATEALTALGAIAANEWFCFGRVTWHAGALWTDTDLAALWSASVTADEKNPLAMKIKIDGHGARWIDLRGAFFSSGHVTPARVWKECAKVKARDMIEDDASIHPWDQWSTAGGTSNYDWRSVNHPAENGFAANAHPHIAIQRRPRREILCILGAAAVRMGYQPTSRIWRLPVMTEAITSVEDIARMTSTHGAYVEIPVQIAGTAYHRKFDHRVAVPGMIA